MKFDAAIIGVGQSGYPLAADLANAGWKIAVIEKEHVGGSCVNYGCTPTKTMIASAKVAHQVNRASDYGIHVSQFSVDFNNVIERRNESFLPSRKSIKESLEKSKNITFYKGAAFFEGEHQIGIEGQEEVIYGEKIFINTGTIPRIPEIKGLDNIPFMTAKTIMDLQELPEHLLILGGGYIALEYAQMMHRLGSEVTIIQKGKYLISREDQDIKEAVEKIVKEEGIKVLTASNTKEVKKDKNQITVITDKTTITGSHLLVATGTVPNTANLKLQNARVETDGHGYVKVNKHLKTNQSHIYAMGDVKGGPEFTHISFDDYRIIKDHLLGEKQRSVEDRPVPYTMFTDPELGRVGISEEQAKEKGFDYIIAKMDTASAARAKESGETKGLYKVIVNKKNNKILGAAILAPHGGEISSMIQIAMMGNLKWQQLRDGVFSHPTYAESLNNLFMKMQEDL